LYEYYPTKSQAQPKILKKLSEHQINQSEQEFIKKKYSDYVKSVKESQVCMGATRRNFQAQYKILKTARLGTGTLKNEIGHVTD
jgi:hypothetical protein